jgi:hypothetical protein
MPPVQLWLGGRGGNANFLFGMNLLWGGLLVMLLLRLLRTAARAEALAECQATASSNCGDDAAGGSDPMQAS